MKASIPITVSQRAVATPSVFDLYPVFYSFWSGFKWFGSILKYFPFWLEGRFILRGPPCGLPSLITWLSDSGWQHRSAPHACSHGAGGSGLVAR